jgi:hypothetical protein
MRIIICLTLFFFSIASWGQANLSSDVIKIRNNIENDIRKNLEDLIATKLEKKTFNVAVRVQLSPIQPPKKEKDENSKRLPDGMDIGGIDVRNLVDSYEKKIAEMKIQKELTKDGKQYQISSLEVFVGLDEHYPAKYGKELQKWLQARLSKDYGSVAKSTVSAITPGEKPPPEAIQEEPLLKKLRPWTSVIAALLLALALTLLGSLLKSGMKAIATAPKALSLDQKGELALSPPPKSDEDKAEDGMLDMQNVTRMGSDNIDQMITKIAFVCLEIGAKVNDLVKVWIDANEEGFTKTALLVDCLVCAREKIMSETGALAPLRIPIEQEMIASYEEHLSEAYRNVSAMDDIDKLEMMKIIYWDLISVRTLGLQSLRRPFDFLSQTSTAEVREILLQQNDDTKALALMYLPKETQSDLLSEMDEFNRLNTIRAMLLNSEVDAKKLWDHDTSVKVVVEGQNSREQSRLVNLFPRTLEAIKSLSPLDEIATLRKVCPSLPNDGRNLKHNYVTFAFVDEWKPDAQRRLTQIATADEILLLMRTIPAAQEQLLIECPPMMKKILEDDLKLNSITDISIQNQKLLSLKLKWSKLLQTENILLSRIYNEQKTSEDGFNAA